MLQVSHPTPHDGKQQATDEKRRGVHPAQDRGREHGCAGHAPHSPDGQRGAQVGQRVLRDVDPRIRRQHRVEQVEPTGEDEDPHRVQPEALLEEGAPFLGIGAR